MSGDVAQPYMATSVQEMVQGLLLGRWLVARWEHLGPDEDLGGWTRTLAAACQAADVDMVAVPLARKSMTLVWNAALPCPTREQVEDSIRAADRARWLGHPIGTKLAVETKQSVLL
ncbi:hypothetical protein NQK81_13215 [Amycolatopsis roodepoortensis]|uniref:hypothetical protein n=1 Tax=Amycolatopsis roodepoortensis TaxID=700274 RepID=UPI00214C26FF|nr:hypothetical protein [Amycolatopsis roodepoortensis]UUV34364.1 hypothetical protein NQK81_13215 [Amycolatopsis roodepoortensis]